MSYTNLFKPRGFDGSDDEPKYSTVIIIPKSDKDTIAKIQAAFKEAAENGKHKFRGNKVPRDLKTTLKDGDVDADLEKNPEYANSYYMNLSSATRPGIVDRELQPILDETEVYSGCWARVSMNAFAYNTRGNQGVSMGLNHVQKLRDDDALDGRTSAEDDFDVVADDFDSVL